MARSVAASVIAPPLVSEQDRALGTKLMFPSRDAAARRDRQELRAVVRMARWTGSRFVMPDGDVMRGGR